MPSTAAARRTSFLPFCCNQAAAQSTANAGSPLFQAFSPIPVWGSTGSDCIKVGVKIDRKVERGGSIYERRRPCRTRHHAGKHSSFGIRDCIWCSRAMGSRAAWAPPFSVQIPLLGGNNSFTVR